jgi:phage/plasmid-associated DNA primase
LVIGRRNVVQLRVGKLNERFETVRCVGKLLLNVVEATADYLNQEGAEVMKALVGHDPMEGEKKNIQEPVSFEGTFPIIVTSNEKLNVRLAGDEAAQSRRVLIIEFPNRRPSDAEIIDHFEQLLFEQESEGIFAWMIEGARKHWLELSQGKGFAVSDPQKRRVEDLINRSKSVETFVLTELNSTPVGDVTTGELYDAYCTSCMAKEWTPFREQKFEEVSRYLILRHFDICKRHDIQRIDASGKTRSRRGYSGIEII